MKIKKIRYWLNHPTQVDVPLFNELASNPSIDLKVIYCNWKQESDLPYDKEINTKSGWDFELLQGYKYEFITPGFFSGMSSFFKESYKNKNELSVIQGTNSQTFRGILLIAFLLRLKVMIRYDATLEYSDGPQYKLLLKKFLLPIFFNLGFDLAYTGKWAKKYLEYYSAKPSKLFWFPYVVNQKWLYEKSKKFKNDFKGFDVNNLKDSLVCIIAAKFSKREAPLDAIRAFSNVKNKNAFLIIVGDGPEKSSIINFINSCDNLQERVLLTGYVSYSKLAELFGISNVFIHPAHQECWGVSVNEAMSCGLPVIASDMVGSGHDLIEEGVTGFKYPVNNLDKLTEIISRLTEDKKLTKELGQNALKKIEFWSPENTSKRIIEFLNNKS
jgi:glycosyltransferase involved in cell wall biosynthesis